MSPFRRQRANTTITASAMAVRPSDTATIKRINGALRPWQTQAIFHYRSMGTIHYPANYYANGLSRFRLYIGERPEDNPTGGHAEIFGADRSDLYRKAEDILLALYGDLGGHPEILRNYGINRMTTGESWLAGQDRGGGPNWELLSMIELRAMGEGQFQRFYDGGTPDPDYRPTTAFRLWNSDPFASLCADSPMFSLANDCQRLLILEQSMTARMCSALAQAGYLYITDGMTMPGALEAPTGDGQTVIDPFALKLFGGMEKSILEGNGKFAPDIVRGPTGQKPEFITVDRVIDRVEMELRTEMRDSIARGLDLPAEAQQGLGGATHWSAWQISDETIGYHMTPAVTDFGNSLNRVYLWPLLQDWVDKTGRDFNLADIQRLSIMGDSSNVATRPNSSEDARQVRDRLAISDSALRRSAGIDDSDAPTDEEYARQMGVRANNPMLAMWGLPIYDLIPWDDINQATVGQGAPGAGGTPTSRRPADPSKPEPVIPDVPSSPGGPAQKPGAANEQAAVVFAAAAHGHLAAARKTVGAKVRALAMADPEAAAAVKNQPNEKVLASLDDWEALGLNDEKVRGLYVESLAPLTEALGDFDPLTVEAFVASLSILATSRQHSPITADDLRRVAFGVLSRSAT